MFFGSVFINIIYSQPFIIDQGGLYRLGQELRDPGIDLIRISTSDVVLDLNQNSLIDGANGIIIEDGLQNITVKNGIISTVTGTAILVGQNCQNLRLTDLDIFSCQNGLILEQNFLGGNFDNVRVTAATDSGVIVEPGGTSVLFTNCAMAACAGAAAELRGTSTQIVRDILFDRVTTSSCVLSPFFDSVFDIDYGRNIFFQQLNIANSGNDFAGVRLFNFNNCIECVIQGALCVDTCAPEIIGVDLNNTVSSVLNGLQIGNSNAGVLGFTGFLFENNSSDNFVTNCNILTVSVENGYAKVASFQDGANGNIFRRCNVAALLADDVIVYDMSPTQTIFTAIFQECEIANCTALTGTFIGFNIDGVDQGSIIDSKVSFNKSVDLAIGILFAQDAGGVNWNIKNNNLTQNCALLDADSYGILVQTGTNNLFMQNVAFNNGDLIGNQLNGVPNGSKSEIISSNVNSVTSPWTNVGVVG